MAYERSEHEKKYDRQMRLWGSHGQLQLETAKIAMCGTGATATETLKNLVLPNVKNFTLIDNAVTTHADKNSNFFIDLHSIGLPRAQVVAELMQEMNPEVKGEAVLKSPMEIITTNNLHFFDQFHLVIVCDPTLPLPQVLTLSQYLYDRNIPMIYIQTKGLLGSARLQVKEHCIIESHPGNDRYDLYCHPEQLKHWPELLKYITKFQIYRSAFPGWFDANGKMIVPSEDSSSSSSSSSSSTSAPTGPRPDGEEHAHIPYIAILGQEILKWCSTHGGVPKTYQEKQEFKKSLRETAWTGEESNFDEAIDFAHRAYDLPKFDKFVQQVFDDPVIQSEESLMKKVQQCTSTTTSGEKNAQSTTNDATQQQLKFWLCARAVKLFVEHEGCHVNMPVSQNLPDMHCKTEYYVELKEIFRVKAEQDFDNVKAHLVRTLEQVSLPPNFVSDADLHHFVKNVRQLRVIRTRSLVEEYGRTGDSNPEQGCVFQTEDVKEILEEEVFDEDAFVQEGDETMVGEDEDGDDDDEEEDNPKPKKVHNPKNIHWYLGLRTAQLFHAKHGRAAGTAADINADGAEMIELEKALLQNMGLSDVIPTPDIPVLAEVTRSAACEPHVTAAFMGGIGAQIALKILLKQYVPLNNTLIWNGVFASSNTFNL